MNSFIYFNILFNLLVFINHKVFLHLLLELHEQRLEELRKKMKWLEDTNWKYAPAEKLIGLE